MAKLTSGSITIDEGGYLDIGSPDCPFTGNATILLTGNSKTYIWGYIKEGNKVFVKNEYQTKEKLLNEKLMDIS